MKLLIDTQILIWALEGNDQLKPPIRLLLEDPTNEILVSQFSLMEIAIKLKLGKLPAFIIQLPELIEQIQLTGFTLLACTQLHLCQYQNVPLYEDHRDPFDRFLIATATAENIPFISADNKFARYRPSLQLID